MHLYPQAFCSHTAVPLVYHALLETVRTTQSKKCDFYLQISKNNHIYIGKFVDTPTAIVPLLFPLRKIEGNAFSIKRNNQFAGEHFTHV